FELPYNKIVLLTFISPNIGSEFEIMACDREDIRNTILYILVMNRFLYEKVFPGYYDDYPLPEKLIEDCMNLFEKYWNNVEPDNRVIICLFPAIENNSEIPKYIFDVLSGCFEFSVYKWRSNFPIINPEILNILD